MNELHNKFVLVPIDKAANNVAIICKRFYVEVILREVGVSGNQPVNQTYVSSDKCVEEIILDSQEFAKKLGLKVEDKDLDLPNMYWMTKMHKSPTGFPFHYSQ